MPGDLDQSDRGGGGCVIPLCLAGRVNRNGELLPALGRVVVFAPEGYPSPAEIRGVIGDMARMRDAFDDLQTPEAIRSYFSEVYWRLEAGLDAKKIVADFTVDHRANRTNFNFRTAAEKFRMIESGMVPVIIPRDRATLDAVAQLDVEQIPSGKIARALQTHLVTVPPKARMALSLINRGQLRAGDFETRDGGAVLLRDDGCKTVLTAWQERKKEERLHPFLVEKLPFGLVPFVQAQLLARHLRGDLEAYPPWFWK